MKIEFKDSYDPEIQAKMIYFVIKLYLECLENNITLLINNHIFRRYLRMQVGLPQPKGEDSILSNKKLRLCLEYTDIVRLSAKKTGRER